MEKFLKSNKRVHAPVFLRPGVIILILLECLEEQGPSKYEILMVRRHDKRYDENH